jgi:hypothetical protein
MVERTEATSQPREGDGLTARIAEVMDEDGGCWSPCSGCQEGVDGSVSETDYPYSATFQCQPGGGCRECGGIGVLWQDGAFLASYGAALTQRPPEQAGAVPAGWKLVPITLTQEMAEAGAKGRQNSAISSFRDGWKYALSAAPTPPDADEAKRDAWSEFETDHLTGGKGQVTAQVYARCREAFDAHWSQGWEKANAAAFAALSPPDAGIGSDGAGWMPIADADRSVPLLVGCWVEEDDGSPRWSAWTVFPDEPLGHDGTWGDEPTHCRPQPDPPALATQPGDGGRS